MNAYVLTQMEMTGDGEQAHVVTRNRSVTFDVEKAQAWANQGVDFDYETFDITTESIVADATGQLSQAIGEVKQQAIDLGQAFDEVNRLIRELK